MDAKSFNCNKNLQSIPDIASQNSLPDKGEMASRLIR